MSLFFRKSKKLFGGFRLNVSNRGLGVSGGIKGLRISSGTRGVQINAGLGGLRLQKSLTGKSKKRSRSAAPDSEESPQRLTRPFNGTAFSIWIISLGVGIYGAVNRSLDIFGIGALIWGASIWFYFVGNKAVAGYRKFNTAMGFSEDDPARASLLKEALISYPNPIILEELAFSYWRSQQFPEALPLLIQLAEVTAKPEIFAATGHCLLKLERAQESLDYLSRVDEAHEYDGFMDVMLLKVESLFELKEFDKALVTIKSALAKRSEKFADYRRFFRLWQARVEHQTGNLKKAEATLQRLLSEAPGFEAAEELLKELKAA